MVFALVKRVGRAVARGVARFGRYWAAQFGLACTLTWAPDAAHLAREPENEHWDWSIPYLWYEASR